MPFHKMKLEELGDIWNNFKRTRDNQNSRYYLTPAQREELTDAVLEKSFEVSKKHRALFKMLTNDLIEKVDNISNFA